MPAVVVIDASVWVSMFIPQDVYQAPSRLWLENYTTGGGFLTAPAFLLVEVAAAIARRTQQVLLAQQAVQYLTTFGSLQLVTIDSLLIKDAIDAAINSRLRAGDAIYVALAQQLGIPLVSWDNEQLRRAGATVVTYTPDNYPF